MEEARRTVDKIPFYRCFGPRACRQVSAVEVYVDQVVTEAFPKVIVDSDNVDAIIAGGIGQHRSHEIATELAELDDRERSLGARLAAGDISDLMMQCVQAYIGPERAELETDLRAAATGQPILTGEQLHALAGMWDRLECADRRAAMEVVIERVTVSKATRSTGSLFDSDRITIDYC